MRLKTSSSSPHPAVRGRQCITNQHSLIDQISMLPDELLVFILSFLTLKKAAMTSILSRRWRYMWTFIPKLDFDGTDSLQNVDFTEKSDKLLDVERRKYVKWVNRVLRSCNQNSTIEEFRVLFDLSKTYRKSIDKWLMHAFSRKVQRLELNLTDDSSSENRSYDECYTFPCKLLHTNTEHPTSWTMRRCNSLDFKYLKQISLNCVNVSGEALDFFLCNCSLLEHLSVSRSGELSSLNISGQFRSLKRLEISFCFNLESLEIRDSNIVYLKYQGSRIHFYLENVPRLVELFIGGMATYHMKDVISWLSGYLPQLEIFTIGKMKFSWEETEMFYSAVKMSNLKQLVVETPVDEHRSLLPLANLIRASPFLQRFVLVAEWMEPEILKREVEHVTMICSYIHLKEVEFVGYFGHVSDLEFIMHLLESGVALEKVAVDTRDPIDYRLKINDDFKQERAARARAKRQLTKKVAPRIKLHIL